MSDSVQTAKAALRNEVRARLKQVTADERARGSLQACSRLKQQAVWCGAKLILFFAPLPGELDIWPLLAEALQAGKEIALPRFDPAIGEYVACRIGDPERDLRAGQLGIREPRAACPRIVPAAADLIMVPGVAFDLAGYRLGRGKGYYDRLLATLEGVKCGVAFEQQVISKVPAEAHDMRLDCLLTPTQWVEFEVALTSPGGAAKR